MTPKFSNNGSSMTPKNSDLAETLYIATGGLYLNMEWRGKSKKVLRVVFGVFIYLLVVFLFIYHFL